MENEVKLSCFVRSEWRGPRGGRLEEWWWFFTVPLVYSVWYRPTDRYGNRGTKTKEEFFQEQYEIAKRYHDEQRAILGSHA